MVLREKKSLSEQFKSIFGFLPPPTGYNFARLDGAGREIVQRILKEREEAANRAEAAFSLFNEEHPREREGLEALTVTELLDLQAKWERLRLNVVKAQGELYNAERLADGFGYRW